MLVLADEADPRVVVAISDELLTAARGAGAGDLLVVGRSARPCAAIVLGGQTNHNPSPK